MGGGDGPEKILREDWDEAMVVSWLRRAQVGEVGLERETRA